VTWIKLHTDTDGAYIEADESSLSVVRPNLQMKSRTADLPNDAVLPFVTALLEARGMLPEVKARGRFLRVGDIAWEATSVPEEVEADAAATLAISAYRRRELAEAARTPERRLLDALRAVPVTATATDDTVADALKAAGLRVVDAGGSTADFQRLQDAKRVLDEHHRSAR